MSNDHEVFQASLSNPSPGFSLRGDIMEKHHKFSIWYVLLCIWFVLLLQNYLVSMFAIRTIPYSEFLRLLKEKKIIEVAITANQIQGKLKDGEAGKETLFKTVRVDPETAKLLEEYNVTFKGEIESNFLPTLLSWILPVFIFFGLWYFLMKRMTGQQPGFMTLGKNKAKIYMQEDLEVRFEDVAGVDEAKQELVQAKQKAPCIIFIDELDALGKARGFGTLGGHDEREQTLNQLLVEMDGFDPKVGVILLAATNRPEILDPALLRPGRFDRNILVDRPDKQGREEILKVHLKNIKVAENLDVGVIAGMTSGMVGADLANLVNEAALLAVRRNKKTVGMSEFEEAVERVVAGLEKKNRLINPREREIVAYHEMGHAIVATTLPGTDPVQKISIIPRGIAALGYTLQTPTEDRFLMNKTELLNRITTFLGGRAAEEIVFEDISTGAHDDLARAADIARSMVKEYGMSPKIGQVYFAREKRTQYLDVMPQGAVTYSEATAELIDNEVKEIINVQYSRALDILGGKREILDKGARLLLDKEKIEGEELKTLLAGN